MMDLTKCCALCGGDLIVVLPDGMTYTAMIKLSDEEIDDYAICKCESRAVKGRCGKCRDCLVEANGCACDGAFDAGCFNCTPREFKRQPCPPENFNRGEAHA